VIAVHQWQLFVCYHPVYMDMATVKYT